MVITALQNAINMPQGNSQAQSVANRSARATDGGPGPRHAGTRARTHGGRRRRLDRLLTSHVRQGA